MVMTVDDGVTVSTVSGLGVLMATTMQEFDPVMFGMACCGALLYVMNSKELSIFARVIYVPISVFIGYFLAGDIMGLTNTTARGLITLTASAVTIAIITRLIDQIKHMDIIDMIATWIRAVFSKKQ